MIKLARFFSAIFSPLLMPTYGIFLAMWVSVLAFLSLDTRLAVLGVIFGITCLIPAIFIFLLYRLKYIKDLGLNIQHERWLPYIFMMLCYTIAALYLIDHHAPIWMSSFVWGALVAVIISFFVNFKWKISGHMAGIGGVVAMLCYLQATSLSIVNITWIICIAIIISGIIGTSRILLDRHTLAQVLVGFANGFICVWLASMFII